MRHSATNLILGGGFILLAAVGTFLAMGRAAVALLLGMVIAYAVWAARGAVYRGPGLLTVYIAGLVVLGLHSSEEFLTGFQHQFPSLFGYDWSDGRFVAFNAAWLAVFGLAAIGMYHRIPPAYLIAWFFALAACIGNGIGHLLLSLSQGRYFPGTFTAPACVIVGILIVRRLAAAETQFTAS